jgi:hypothetical protein
MNIHGYSLLNLTKLSNIFQQMLYRVDIGWYTYILYEQKVVNALKLRLLEIFIYTEPYSVRNSQVKGIATLYSYHQEYIFLIWSFYKVSFTAQS